MDRLNSKQLYVLSLKMRWKYPIKCHDIRMSRSIKSRECVYCGCEIPKGDYYYSYKPILGKRKSRCLDHKPTIYNDYEKFDY